MQRLRGTTDHYYSAFYPTQINPTSKRSRGRLSTGQVHKEAAKDVLLEGGLCACI